MARTKSKGPTKLSLVKEALLSGIEAPLEIQAHLQKLNVTMTAAAISNYKSVLKSQAAAARPTEAAKPGRKKRRGKRRMAQGTQASASNGPAGASGYADMVARLKDLVKSLGADEVKKLTDILG